MLIPIKSVKFSSLFGGSNTEFRGIGGLVSPDATEFRRALSSVRIGRTFKTTARNRLPELTSYLTSLGQRFRKVIDVGASDGSAALSFIKALEFGSYCLTDKYIELVLVRDGHRFWLYDQDGVLHMYQVGDLLFYLDPLRQWRSPLERALTSFLSRREAPSTGERLQVICINPDISHCGKNYRVLPYDCNNSWLEESGDLILVANLLDKFIDKPDVMERFCSNIRGMVANGGLVVVADNEGKERATVFRLQGRDFEVAYRIGGGSIAERQLHLEL
jgi:hypothetical protein